MLDLSLEVHSFGHLDCWVCLPCLLCLVAGESICHLACFRRMSWKLVSGLVGMALTPAVNLQEEISGTSC